MVELNKQKIFWHSRRGMLELDLLLIPFTEEAFDALSPQDQMLYVELLAFEDQELFGWFLERVEPADSRFKPLIGQILAHNANTH